MQNTHAQAKLFQSFTGITGQQLDFLSKKIESEYKTAEEKQTLQKEEKKKHLALDIHFHYQ
jgi:hypothetical protein